MDKVFFMHPAQTWAGTFFVHLLYKHAWDRSSLISCLTLVAPGSGSTGWGHPRSSFLHYHPQAQPDNRHHPLPQHCGRLAGVHCHQGLDCLPQSTGVHTARVHAPGEKQCHIHCLSASRAPLSDLYKCCSGHLAPYWSSSLHFFKKAMFGCADLSLMPSCAS